MNAGSGPTGPLLVQANGLRFHCRVDGPPGAPWLVFSNSLLTNLSLWDDQVATFANDYRILRYDQRGHGATAVPAYSSTFDLLVDDVLALFDRVGIERATFVGVSMGGVTGLRLAVRQPDRLVGLAACAAQWRSPTTAIDVWDERIACARAHGTAALVESTVARWFRPEFVASGAPALDRVRQMIGSTPVDGFVSCARALQRYDFCDDLIHLRVPTLLLVGEADGPLPGVMRDMHDAMPGSRFARLTEAGHLPNLENPVSFNQALAAFLRELAHARS